jgi:hypothetical protein
MFKSGKVVIRFNDITETDVYLNAGSSIHDAKDVISDGVEQYKEYTVDMSQGSVFAIVVPKDGKDKTSFSMQYWVDGDETSALTEWWWRNFTTSRGKAMLAFVIICIVLLCGVFGFGIRYYIKSQVSANKI